MPLDGGWSAFGGGCAFSEARVTDFCEAGVVVSYQVLRKLQIGGELFQMWSVANRDRIFHLFTVDQPNLLASGARATPKLLSWATGVDATSHHSRGLI